MREHPSRSRHLVALFRPAEPPSVTAFISGRGQSTAWFPGVCESSFFRHPPPSYSFAVDAQGPTRLSGVVPTTPSPSFAQQKCGRRHSK
ncbi:unnamed protein product [Lactuca virosa]|uniref:Uncharacterized protein n=1 Tax=Lactuca virosa TaxID=75947 RepID=A0AAU9LUJ9_9ASTR|nr:unnamed protein product [Lactuca virosa]